MKISEQQFDVSNGQNIYQHNSRELTNFVNDFSQRAPSILINAVYKTWERNLNTISYVLPI